mgnify:CR=1 FL=1
MKDKLFLTNGFLSEFGKKEFGEHLIPGLLSLLNEAENETEVQLIASLIQQKVGEVALNFKLQKSNK